MKALKLAAFTILIVFLSAISSKAVIVVENSLGSTETNLQPFTQATVETPTGRSNDFEIITCGTFSGNSNSFLSPSPDEFNLLDQGSCGNGFGCIQGIWSRFVDTAGGSDNFCNWTVPVNVFGAGSIRWSGVDRDKPVVAIACDTGEGDIATTPSVNAEDGSYVVRLYTLGPALDSLVTGATSPTGGFTAIAVLEGEELVVHGETAPADGAGPTGTKDYSVDRFSEWRACTITLRVAPLNIPALSEWGLGIFAALTGLAGVLVLRRRAQRESA